MKVYPRPTGEIQGDSSPIPMKGTGTGFSATPLHADQESMGMDQDSCNCMGAIGRYTKSDKGEQV
ncbi:MAG: hypothetical protein ACK51V_00630 [bacterium]|jgi:hypothetical protein|nr:hypothetical protein [Betaproteobacteria bacterium]